MRRVEDGQPLRPEVGHAGEDGVAALRIDADRGLVEHEQPRAVEESDADVETALHPPGELARPVVGTLGQRDQLQHLADTRLQHPPRQALEAAEEAQVLARREIRVDGQVLRHVADGRLGIGGPDVDRPSVHDDLATVSTEQPADHRDRRRLAGAVGAQQAVRLASGDRETDPVHRGARAEALAQITAVEHGRRHGDPSSVAVRQGRGESRSSQARRRPGRPAGRPL